MSSDDMKPPKGYWIDPDDSEYEDIESLADESDEFEWQDEESGDDEWEDDGSEGIVWLDDDLIESVRRARPQFDSLMDALEANQGDFAAALTAMGLELELDDQGNVTRIIAFMFSGQFDTEEFALLAQIPTLDDISLRGVEITNEGLAVLEQMPQLKRLSLDAEAITDHGLIYVRRLRNLEALFLEGTTVDGSGLAHLPNPERLTWLDLTHCPITDEGLKQVVRLSSLESLGLWKTGVTDAGLTHLKSCRRLKRLNLDDTAVTNAGLKELADLPELTSLDLSDTRVTDECLDLLLQFPKLKNVSFGSEQISASTLERLQQAGIEVSYGQLLNVRREEDLLRYDDMDYEVDPNESALRAYMQPGKSDVAWAIEIACTDKYVPDDMQPPHLDGPAIPSNKGWKELVGEELEISFDDDELHPILPDNPCNFYVGWHAAPNHHRIKFLKRYGNRFLIDWHCVAQEGPDDEGEPVWVYAEVPFTGVTVWSEGKMTLAEAQQVMARHFDLADFHEPEINQTKRSTHVSYKLRVPVDDAAER